MRIFVSAAEISSDIHAEKILRALLEIRAAGDPAEKIEICGIGGPRLRAIPGFRVLARAEDLRAMGFIEVLFRLREIRAIRNRVVDALRTHPPDLILTFDYPDFHFSLMGLLEREEWFPRALRICGIPPKVWVWRQGRVEAIRRLYDGVWVIFPFEKEFYEKCGIPVIYEGNPLIAELLKHDASKMPLRTAEGVAVAVLPGSREGELDRHLPIVPGALHHLSRLLNERVIAEVPVPEGVSMERIASVLVSSDRVWYRLVRNGSAEVLARNSIGLIKSGTSTLEAAVMGCVPVIFYRMNSLSEWLFKHLVRYGGPVGLPNILLGIRKRSENEFPELLGKNAAGAALAVELGRLLQDPAHRSRLQALGTSLRGSLAPRSDVAQEAAARIQEWFIARPAGAIRRRSSVWISLGSFVWSAVNATRRTLRAFPGMRPNPLPVRSVLVGNLQAGGAGKTPFVMELAREARRRGFRAGIVTRGYGGSYPEKVRIVSRPEDPRLVGDEVSEMTRELPGIPVALSADRQRAARALKEEGVDLIIADDGFQNLGFRADVTVLLVTDANRSETLYRDFDSAAGAADLVYQTKGRVLPASADRFPGRITLEWEPEELPGKPVWIWTAIGDPSELAHFYRSHGVRIEKMVCARDHALPRADEVKDLIEQARKAGALLAVTPKDAVKIPAELLGSCFILRRHLKRSPALIEGFERIFQGLQSSSVAQ
jgi:lipid-A-disaccharide synthase